MHAIQKLLIVILISFTFILTGCSERTQNDKTINVVFRYDDYSALSNTDVELKIIDIFKKNRASLTIGVIPFVISGNQQDPSPQNLVPLTREKAEILKAGLNDGVLDVALHGYSHQTFDASNLTEFSWIDYGTQLEKITKGKKFLENMINSPVTIFVPPWDNCDSNTIRVLEELGFQTISASRVRGEIGTSRLNFLPSTSSISNLRTSILAARQISYSQPIVVVLFHSYDFIEVDKSQGITTIQEFINLMSWLNSQNDIKIMSIGHATKIIRDLSVNRFISAPYPPPLNAFIESTLNEKEKTKFLYREINIPINTWIRVINFYFVIMIIGLVPSFLFGYFVLSKGRNILKLGAIASVIMTVLTLIYTFYDLHVYRKNMMVSMGLIGISIGLILVYFFLYGKLIRKKSE
jgi:peptidoglycan/xylan/chitin deacetylase (PgdA/CDA1 family)